MEINSVWLALISFIANFFSALAGGGAGLLQLPALLFLGLPFATALATHKFASVFLGVGATLKHLRTAQLSLGFVGLILAFGLPGVYVGTQVILQIPDSISQFALGVLTICLGFYSWLKPSLGQALQLQNQNFVGLFVGGLVLFAIGALNGSLTSGTGLFVTLWLVRWFGFDYKLAVAYTLILVGIFWNGAGAIALALSSPIEWHWLPALIVGSLVGGYLGAHLATVVGNQWVKRSFEWMTILVGLALIFKS